MNKKILIVRAFFLSAFESYASTHKEPGTARD
jgi:hypothetical protein